MILNLQIYQLKYHRFFLLNKDKIFTKHIFKRQRMGR